MAGFLARWLFAFLLLAITYNPTEWNYLIWLKSNWDVEPAIAVLVGLLLTAGYIIYLRATLRSIGPVGIGLVAAIVAAVIWVLIDQGLFKMETSAVRTWMGIVALSFVLGIGLSWSFVRRFLSGQYDVDDSDE